MNCNHKSIIQTSDGCLICKNFYYLYKYSNNYSQYAINASKYYSERYFSTNNVDWGFDKISSSFAAVFDSSNPIKKQAEEMVDKDPYMIRIRDEALHLEKLLDAKRREVTEYEKFTLETTYNKLLKNKAFL